ncbi:hypothetical protein RDI58_022664 [Solanum bulbocastanum]|uniref:C2H2-type domain-containing protein n=1 Tax=Solanum bulbocastanum TaxID=147425 RepID=A0AAN8T4H5_SOLBU
MSCTQVGTDELIACNLACKENVSSSCTFSDCLERASATLFSAHLLNLTHSLSLTTWHKCPACYKQCKRKEHIIEHMRTSHHSVHDPTCGVCNNHCKSFESLREHMAGPLAKVNCSNIFAERGCILCLKICSSVDSLNKHKEMCHLTTPQPIVS